MNRRTLLESLLGCLSYIGLGVKSAPANDIESYSVDVIDHVVGSDDIDVKRIWYFKEMRNILLVRPKGKGEYREGLNCVVDEFPPNKIALGRYESQFGEYNDDWTSGISHRCPHCGVQSRLVYCDRYPGGPLYCIEIQSACWHYYGDISYESVDMDNNPITIKWRGWDGIPMHGVPNWHGRGAIVDENGEFFKHFQKGVFNMIKEQFGDSVKLLEDGTRVLVN